MVVKPTTIIAIWLPKRIPIIIPKVSENNPDIKKIITCTSLSKLYTIPLLKNYQAVVIRMNAHPI